MSVGFTVGYVTGQVGCGRYYEDKFGRRCQGFQANMELHHTSNTSSHYGLCFVVNPINTMLGMIVNRTPPSNVDSRYPAFSMEECISKLWDVKFYEDQLALQEVDNVMECDPHKDLSYLKYFVTAGDNFDTFLERARPSFLESVGLDRNTPDAYKFKRRSRPDFVHETVILQEFRNESARNKHWRILHGRCPITGLGGTKPSGRGSNRWPLVCHHIEYGEGEPWSLVAFCNTHINVGLECLEGDPAAGP